MGTKEYMSEEEMYGTIECCISDYEDVKKEIPEKLILGIANTPSKVMKDGFYPYKGKKIPVIIQEETYKEGCL